MSVDCAVNSICYWLNVMQKFGYSQRSIQRFKEHPNPKGIRCLEEVEQFSRNKSSLCSPVWDNIYCWTPTAPDTVVRKPCPLEHGYYPNDSAHRTCLPNGTWKDGLWTNFSACRQIVEESGLKNPPDNFIFVLRDIIICCSCFSLMFLAVALFVFSYFRSIRCAKVAIHRNLVLSFLLWYILILFRIAPYAQPNFQNKELDLRSSKWFCRILQVLFQYFTICNVQWMLVEGLHLHSKVTIQVFEYSVNFKLFYFLGWGLPWIFVLPWTIVTASTDKKRVDELYWKLQNSEITPEQHGSLYEVYRCWDHVKEDNPYKWLLNTPIILGLLINLIFFVNILRILVTKIKTTEPSNYLVFKKSVRAIGILLPMLGVYHLLLFINFGNNDNGAADKAWTIVQALLQCIQGAAVSVVYCFINRDVQHAIRSALHLRSKKSKNYNSSVASVAMKKRQSCDTELREKTLCITPQTTSPLWLRPIPSDQMNIWQKFHQNRHQMSLSPLSIRKNSESNISEISEYENYRVRVQ